MVVVAFVAVLSDTHTDAIFVVALPVVCGLTFRFLLMVTSKKLRMQ